MKLPRTTRPALPGPGTAGQQVLITPPPESAATGAATLWTHLADVCTAAGRRAHVAFEYAWTRTGVQISMWVPDAIAAATVAKAIESAWPGAHTATATPAALFPEDPARPEGTTDFDNAAAGLSVLGGRLRLARPDCLPIKTDHDADPLRALFAAAQPHTEADRTIVQILARPATVAQLANAVRDVTLLRAGKPLSPTVRLLDALLPRRAGKADYPERTAQAKAALDKMAHPRFEVVIRYAVVDLPDISAPSHPYREEGRRQDEQDHQLRERADRVAAAFALYTGRHNRLATVPLRDPARALTDRTFDHGHVLSVPELAALAHLPTDPAIPGLARAGARAVPPPPAVPTAREGTKLLGDSDTGIPRTVAVPVADARHHIHVAGATGSGKTTLLTHWILSDAAQGRGAVVLDCKGDQINDLLDRLPLEAADRTVLIDTAQPGPPPGINPLAGPDPYLAVDHLVGIFRQMYADSWGPRTDDILRAACLTLATQPGARAPATLADVPRLLTEPAYRYRIVGTLTDSVLHDFWTWYDHLSTPGRAAAIGPVQNKLRALLLRPFVRAVIAQPHTSIDLGHILDGGLLLVRIPKGELGDDTVRLLGSLILAALWEYTTHRARLGEQLRRDAAVYIDEAFNYLNLIRGLEDLLAEARAFRLSLVLAHQDLAQIPKDLRESLSANARNKVFFAVSPEDARAYERHVQPNLSIHDLVHLDAFQVVARLIIASAVTPAFTFRTRPLPDPIPGRADALRQLLATRAAPVVADERPSRADPRTHGPDVDAVAPTFTQPRKDRNS